jgi:hypothetical protein
MTTPTTNSSLLDALAKLNANVAARLHTYEPAQVQNTAPSAAVKLGMTRASWWARKNGGGYRTARTEKKCQQFGCYRPIAPGEQYFDTNEPTIWPNKKHICAMCAEELV